MDLKKYSSLIALKDELTRFQSNDLLVQCQENSKQILSLPAFNLDQSIQLPFEGLIKKIELASQENSKQSGISSICLAVGNLNWNYKNNPISTPILLYPISTQVIKKNTPAAELFIEVNSEAIINPFLISTLQRDFEINLSTFEFKLDNLIQLGAWLTEKGIENTIEVTYSIGNFHPHRIHLLKEVEQLIQTDDLTPSLLQLLGEQEEKSLEHIHQTEQLLYPADVNHEAVFQAIQQENIVVQGPPGTGKSQVLSNILGKCLFEQQNALVVSDKRVALEVLYKKLQAIGLNDFLTVLTSETKLHDFYQSLETVWQKVEYHIPTRKTNLTLSRQFEQQLQLQIDLLTSKELVGGVTFDTFKQLTQSISLESGTFISDAPLVSEWLTDEPILRKIVEQNIHLLLRYIPLSTIKSERIFQLDQVVNQLKKAIENCASTLSIDTLQSLEEGMKKAAICQMISNQKSNAYFQVLVPQSKEQKKYLSLKKKFLKNQQALLAFEHEHLHWRENISKLEAESLLNGIHSSSFWQRRKAKKRIKQVLFETIHSPETALQNWMIQLQLKHELSLILTDFCELGIENPEIELGVIDRTIQQIQQFEWEIYWSMSDQERNQLTDYHLVFQQIKSGLTTYFLLEPTTSFQHFFELFEAHFSSLLILQKELILLHDRAYRLLKKANSIEEYEQIVYTSNWTHFKSLFPELAQFELAHLNYKFKKIIALQEEEQQIFATSIWDKIHHQFQAYHHLLQTSSTRLSEDQKQFKQRLKKGKAILVKEFAKTRNHPSIREIVQTDAYLWIALLKPIWLSNPVFIAQHLPLQKEAFDWCVMDEASQMLLTNALGSVYRAKRIVVAGDEQQMSPTHYFQTGQQEGVSVLHQAQFYWNTIGLKHHYRSQHPQLIAFSNQYFYQNELITYPAAKLTEQPLNWHYIPTGRYIDGKNEIEAAAVAKKIMELLVRNTEQKIGIVAFSQTQLACIWNQLPTPMQEKLQAKVEANSCFFKPLEQVQGEECDCLLVSLGYAKNEQDEFHMRFGPVNQQGGSKRLNVLFTRAKEVIHVFSSVQASDFKLTENESVRLLQLYLYQLAHPVSTEKPIFPYQLEPIQSGTTLTFQSILNELSNVKELITLHRALIGRGWEINYI